MVENAVALADFTVDGETIRKGSWYVAIEPTEEGKAAIEKGEFTGVSIEGFATRELVEKHSFRTDNPHTMEVPAMPIATLKSEMDKLAEAIVKGLGLPTAEEGAAKATEDRIAQSVVAQLAGQQESSKAAWWCEAEGIDPVLAGVFGPPIQSGALTRYRPDAPPASVEQRPVVSVSKAHESIEENLAVAEEQLAQLVAGGPVVEPPVEKLRKAYEGEGMDPALAGLF